MMPCATKALTCSEISWLFQVAVYVPGSKGAPSFVRLYQYPNFGGPQSALANKSFFKADKVTMLWNKKGITAVY